MKQAVLTTTSLPVKESRHGGTKTSGQTPQRANSKLINPNYRLISRHMYLFYFLFYFFMNNMNFIENQTKTYVSNITFELIQILMDPGWASNYYFIKFQWYFKTISYTKGILHSLLSYPTIGNFTLIKHNSF